MIVTIAWQRAKTIAIFLHDLTLVLIYYDMIVPHTKDKKRTFLINNFILFYLLNYLIDACLPINFTMSL